MVIDKRKTKGAVVSCNVSYKKLIDEPTLVGILSGQLPMGPWRYHMETFFNEAPKDIILGVMEENNLSLIELKKVFYSLPPVLQGKNFKDLLHEFA